MTLNLLIPIVGAIFLLIFSFTIVKVLFKSKKKSAESIYKLIDELEKKYIY